MARVTAKMEQGIKDTMSVIISEMTGNDRNEVRKWLDTVKTAEDFFGTNKQGLAEYNAFIRTKEEEYKRAQRNALNKL